MYYIIYYSHRLSSPYLQEPDRHEAADGVQGLRHHLHECALAVSQPRLRKHL